MKIFFEDFCRVESGKFWFFDGCFFVNKKSLSVFEVVCLFFGFVLVILRKKISFEE